MTLLSEDIQAEVLGLTDSHIEYFAQDSAKPNKKIGIHKRMLPAYEALVEKAHSAGITLEIASGFRTFERQLLIWNNKFSGNTVIKNIDGEPVKLTGLSPFEIAQAILLYSALPGASRHHWGSDIDVYAPNLLDEHQSLQLEPWEYEKSGPMEKLSHFLNKEAEALGFYFPYDDFRGGVAKEPWHLSYAPLANKYEQAVSINLLEQALNNTNIHGKIALIDNLSVIVEQFVLNVNPNNLSTQTKLTGSIHG
jgi:LAS superfamily LD-carboxypeptidase LdcB